MSNFIDKSQGLEEVFFVVEARMDDIAAANHEQECIFLLKEGPRIFGVTADAAASKLSDEG